MTHYLIEWSSIIDVCSIMDEWFWPELKVKWISKLFSQHLEFFQNANNVLENTIFPFRCQSIWIQFCGKFKPHVSDSFTLNPWEGCVATAIACPEHLSLLVNPSWGQRDGEGRDEETSLGRPREYALWAQDSGPGGGPMLWHVWTAPVSHPFSRGGAGWL